ncbi:MAG: gamma-glutamyltransferase [Oscillospiraceae bacterium]|nr:gamma-glutamyltransferase [Oscillospiraceae bacterium]MCM0706345.1 gamma-glutamyltransferase [Faecalicatena sp. BF-R-105]MDY3218323.1 gamma-glutamyltransferase [Candidatus Fimivivens sp.]SFI57744.1 gamma-glutamyltranspeptidase / glutathione hydrolase [Ruminococcaceae bacterium D5]GKH49466.1 gamma-glutamyltranspeptidase [Eubacteriales bacterium]
MKRLLAWAAAALLISGCAAPAPPQQSVPAASGPAETPSPAEVQTLSSGSAATGKNAAVSSANPAASAIGAQILQRGGNAVDAAVAVSFALGLLEPNASGVGGCGYAVYVPAVGEPAFYDYRSAAPAAFDPGAFTALPAEEQKHSVAAAGVPGAVAGWLSLHEQYGRLPLDELLEPAIDLSENGFEVLPFLASLFTDNYNLLLKDESCAALLLNDDFPYMEGEVMKNPGYAKTLRKIAAEGRDGFYQGEIAEAIVSASSARGGTMTLEDLASYEVRVGKPLEGNYRGFTILTSAPSSSGGIALIESLNLLERCDLPASGVNTPLTLHRMGEAFKIANADRYSYVGDPAFTDIPTEMLISKEYADERAALLSDERVLSDLEVLPDNQSTSTTHLSIIDAEGNAVSMTNTLGTYFGCAVAVDGWGFLLDNQLHDFSIEEWEANAPEPGKRPRSSMTPTVLLRDGKPVAALGSPGGEAIVSTVAQIICDLVDFGMPVDEAINLPRIYQNCTGPLVVEGGHAESTLSGLEALGHTLQRREELDYFFGGVHAVVRNADGTLTGAADPRRDGGVCAY